MPQFPLQEVQYLSSQSCFSDLHDRNFKDLIPQLLLPLSFGGRFSFYEYGKQWGGQIFSEFR